MNGPEQREAWVRTHLPRVLRVCTVILKDPRDAEDAVQEVFLKAFRSIDRFRGDGSVSTWLTRIAIHACKDRIRQKKRRREVSDEEVQQAIDPKPDPMETHMARQMAEAALSSLSPRQEVLVRMRFGGGYTLREIAAALKCSESTAKTHLRRALFKMGRTLEGEGR